MTLLLAFLVQVADAEAFDRLLDALPVVDEIDAAAQAPVHESVPGASRVETILGRAARTLPVADAPRLMGWVLGRGKGLKPGAAYVLSVEFPDDVPRSIFLANRGADLVRGWATGPAFGDARQQFVQPSVESLAWPQTGRWSAHRQLFFLHHRFQDLRAQRDPKPGGRPRKPEDGFHVLVFQVKRLNDPRSQGAAIGRIRLHAVPDPAALFAQPEPPPAGLPRRRIFFREEMADEAIMGAAPEDRCAADPADWFLWKARMGRMLGINVFAKDLLEFGFNQGWETGDEAWVMGAKPPLSRLWQDLVPKIAAEGLEVLPYYEYKGALGYPPKSLGWQRRAEKLYHTKENPRYTDIAWVEDHNADLTDPDALADAKRLLDRTVVGLKGQTRFAGAWFRVRDNHLPMSFSAATLARFKPDATRAALVASFEGDRKLYDEYVRWWLGRRRAFFDALQTHLAAGLGDPSVRLLFTPWTGEQVPLLRDPGSGAAGHPVQVTTDDPAWWDVYARKVPDALWFRWALVPTPFEAVARENVYGRSLAFREKLEPRGQEFYHSAPNADPETYRDHPSVMLTYPMGRMFAVARADLLESYRSAAGLAAIRHYSLNEDNHDASKGPSDLPFDGLAGYISVDSDRAGAQVRVQEARAVALADPHWLGALCGSAMSTGFPGQVRRFNAAFTSVPALPSTVVPGAASDPEVVVREVKTPKDGTWYLVVNPTWTAKAGVGVKLPAAGPIRDLLEKRTLNELRLDLPPGDLRSFHVR